MGILKSPISSFDPECGNLKRLWKAESALPRLAECFAGHYASKSLTAMAAPCVARRAKHGGGGGSRTRVPGTFRESIYTFSGFFDVVPGARTHTLTVHPRMWNVGGSPMRRTPALACWRRSAPLAGVRGRTGYKIMQPLEDILLHL